MSGRLRTLDVFWLAAESIQLSLLPTKRRLPLFLVACVIASGRCHCVASGNQERDDPHWQLGNQRRRLVRGRAGPSSDGPSRERNVIVKYRDEVGRSAAEASAKHVSKRLKKIKAVAGKFSEEEIESLSQRRDIEYVEEDPPIQKLCSDGGSILQSIPYGIDMVQSYSVSAATHRNGDPIVTVCIIDSGLDIDHEDIQKKNIVGKSFGKVGDWDDSKEPHGSHVTGVIAALGSDECGVVGVAHGGNLKLLVARILDDNNEYAKTSTLIEAAEWCADNGADVINMSLGGTSKTKSLDEAFSEIYHADGALLVAAAGNNGNTDNKNMYPASLGAVISVGSVGPDGVVAPDSQWNEEVELAAPGVAVLSTTNTDTGRLGLVSLSGTTYHSVPMEYALSTNHIGVSGVLVDCGFGDDTCPSDTNGRAHICLLERGSSNPDEDPILYVDKVKACEEGGGIGAIVYNNVDQEPVIGTLFKKNKASIPVVGITMADGKHLANNSLGEETNIVARYDVNYEFMSGTSMAAPHVSGVAAIVWSQFPNCTNSEIRKALQETAKDVGDDGRDDFYGFGIVQARDTLNYLNRTGCDGSRRI